MRNNAHILLILLLLVFASCNSTKFVPKGKYLLNKTKVQVLDTKNVSSADLKKYVRQNPNREVLGFWKMQLDIYNWQGPDSAKWINRQIRKLGEAPEVYDEQMTTMSMSQLEKAMHNKGYFNATVDTTLLFTQTKKQKQEDKGKVKVTYNVTAREPYKIRSYTVDITRLPALREIAEWHCPIEAGQVFDADKLDEERQRITEIMRIRGYYYFEKDYLTYEADSSFRTNEVEVKLRLQDYVLEASDSIQRRLFKQYKIGKIFFITNSDLTNAQMTELDTVVEGDYVYIRSGKRLLRNSVLKKSCQLKPGKLYNIRNVERTYSELNMLPPVKFVNISFQQSSDDEVDCYITASRTKIHSVSAELEGTYSAGDWGVALGATYSNKNLFGGGELFTLSGKASYEWRSNGGRGIEGKVDATLRFPSRWQLNVGYNYQQRPEEFTRTIVNGGVSYSLYTHRNRWRHTFNVLDISYVYLPWISDRFREEFLQPTNILKYSYEDHFIVDWSYSGYYTSFNKLSPLRNYSTVQYTIETAGNALYGISKLFGLPQDENGAYEIFKIPYSQYVKADANWTYHQIFDKNNRLVFHIGAGVAVPFGNASSIPFEKRYFAGGANSVRGWTIRSLGPGGYRGSGTRIDYNNQSGDIKLDLNLEYRVRVVWALEFALFTDAGNIWTIRDYESQPYGVFRFDEFYKQIAWSYGAGIRLNFEFLVLRLDWGCKIYDPSRLYYDQKQWRTVSNGLGWNSDMALHFAIGYPF